MCRRDRSGSRDDPLGDLASVARVEQLESRLDDLVARDDLRREDGWIDLACVAHDEVERCGAVDDPVDVELDLASERRDLDEVLDRRREHLTRSGSEVFCRDDVAVDLLVEQLLGDDLDQLHADAVVDQVLGDEELDLLDVGSEHYTGILGGGQDSSFPCYLTRQVSNSWTA